jgi:hypothetical protein
MTSYRGDHDTCFLSATVVLVYKQESDIPKLLRRKLNSLSGLFETADDQFDRVRVEREAYKQSVKETLGNRDEFLEQETNLDTFTEFLKWRFPSQKPSYNSTHLSNVLSATIKYKYPTLSSLDDLLKRTERAREAFNTREPSPFGVSNIALAIAFENPDYRNSGWEDDQIELINDYEHLLAQ